MTVPAGPHVFGDRRFGCWFVTPSKNVDRCRNLRALGVTDAFLPRTATQADFSWYRSSAGGGFLSANLWEAVDGRNAVQYGRDVAADIAAKGAGAADLNIELPNDVDLEPYCRVVVATIRETMPSRRLRLNVAWRKGAFLPIDLLVGDPNLFACEQNYIVAGGADMVPTSAADALDDLLRAGVPSSKAAVCYGGAGPSPKTSSPRVCTMPTAWIPLRGVVFQDDLLAEVGAI